jgi:hypothetical protein
MFDKSIYLNSLKIKFNILHELANEAGQPGAFLALTDDAPIVQCVELLINAANGVIAPSPENIQAVMQSRHRLTQTLCGSPFDPAPAHIPSEFNASHWGWLLAHVDVAMLGDTLITATQAAVLLRGSAEKTFALDQSAHAAGEIDALR